MTLGGAVARPGVYEIAFGSPMADLLRAAGAVSANAPRRCWSAAGGQLARRGSTSGTSA